MGLYRVLYSTVWWQVNSCISHFSWVINYEHPYVQVMAKLILSNNGSLSDIHRCKICTIAHIINWLHKVVRSFILGNCWVTTINFPKLNLNCRRVTFFLFIVFLIHWWEMVSFWVLDQMYFNWISADFCC